MNTFNLALSKYLGRAEVYRLYQAEMNSDLIRVSVDTDARGIGVYRENQPMHVEMTSENDAVIFKIEKLAYGVNEIQGASILSRIKRYFETRQTRFVTATRETFVSSEESLSDVYAIVGVYTRTRKNGVNEYAPSSAWDNGAKFTLADTDCFSLMIRQFIERTESGKTPQDQRKETWDGIVTSYGHFVAQRKAQAVK